MNTKRLINYGSIISFGLGLISLYVGIHMSRKAKKAINNLDKAIDDLANKTSVEISDAIINKAADMLLKGADTYDEFNELVDEQEDATTGSIWKVIVPTIVSLAALGVAAFEYVTMRIKSEQYYDAAELLVNEAAADNEMNMKGSK